MNELAVVLLNASVCSIAVDRVTCCLDSCVALSITNGLKYIAFDNDAPSRQDHDPIINAAGSCPCPVNFPGLHYIAFVKDALSRHDHDALIIAPWPCLLGAPLSKTM